MRLKLGRPDLTMYDALFNVPATAGNLGVTFLGVSTLLLDDSDSAVMTDGFFSRPSLRKVAFGKLAAHPTRIDSALTRLGLNGATTGRRLVAVLPVHSHFDHAMDSAAVANRVGAVLVGGESTANVGRGSGLGDDRIHVVTPGEPVTYGAFTFTFLESQHCPPDRYPGRITEPVVPPVKAAAYKCGDCWSILVEHSTGRTALLQGSAGYVSGALNGRQVDVAYLGVGQLGVLNEGYIRDYWAQTVQAVGARRVVLTHWDDFFRPLDRPLRALPYAGDDLDVTLRVLGDLADRQGVSLHLPTLWRREDPWADPPD
jgi:L-ascorbate metabolism protein UlaG (beta-lactamase superfamily)